MTGGIAACLIKSTFSFLVDALGHCDIKLLFSTLSYFQSYTIVQKANLKCTKLQTWLE